MRAYLALMRIDLKLALRDRSVIFFNYLFPLIFFFAFAEMMGAARGGTVTNVVTMVLTIGILGNGLWGAGMRAVQEREMNILRRFKVTPISPAPILIASMVTGWLIYLPAVLLVCGLAHGIYGMPLPERWFSLFAMITLGVFAFRSIGLILASIVNSTQESTIGIQLLYMPMLFLSGATFPTVMLPSWAQIVGQFLPATYLVTGFQSVFLRKETLAQNWPAAAALLVTMVLATFISIQIFRWEKGEKMRPAAKLWVLAVLSPFVAMGCYQAYSKDHKQKAELLWRELQRNDTFLIRGARIFVGSGKVIESGAALVRNGKIQEVYTGAGPGGRELRADVIEAAGKTLLPGLIEVHAHLETNDPRNSVLRELAAYLYSGVTAVESAGDAPDRMLAARSAVANGSRLGAALFVSGSIQGSPKTAEDARRQVRALKQAGADGIAASSDPPIESSILKAIAEEARAADLPLVVQTRKVHDVEKALDASATSIERGSLSEQIPEALFARMAKAGVMYDPTLSVLYAYSQAADGRLRLLDRSLVLQVGPKAVIESARRAIEQDSLGPPEPAEQFEIAKKNLLAAYRSGVKLTTGSHAGNRLVTHGPTVQQELELWVQAGIPAPAALQAATYNAARSLRADQRFGTIEAGREANLLLVDGDPLSDISVTERISLVVYRGERIRRSALFDQK